MNFSKLWPIALVLCHGLAAAGEVRKDSEHEFRPTGRGTGELDESAVTGNASKAAAKVTAKGANGINYGGGPLLNSASGTNLYYIWYGNWTGNTAPAILTDLAAGLNASPYFNINTSYADKAGKKVTNAVHLLQQTTDNYSLGKVLSDAQIQTVVSTAIISGRLPKDANAVYFVLTSADVNASSGFCTQYCGWHSKGSIGGATIKYSFVGNPDRCPGACAPQSIGPNGNAGADGMASLLAHELVEAVTDPEFNGWYDSRGLENGDKCAWTFGTQKSAANGAKYNMTLGNRNYLIQQNWVNAGGGFCALKY